MRTENETHVHICSAVHRWRGLPSCCTDRRMRLLFCRQLHLLLTNACIARTEFSSTERTRCLTREEFTREAGIVKADREMLSADKGTMGCIFFLKATSAGKVSGLTRPPPTHTERETENTHTHTHTYKDTHTRTHTHTYCCIQMKHHASPHNYI